MKQSESRLGGREAEKFTATTNMKTSNKLKLLKFAAIWCCFLQILASASDPPSIITDNLKKPITFEQGWAILQGAFDRVISTVQGVDNQSLTSEEYMEYYTTVYNMCTQKPPHDYSQELYDKYRESYEEYITSMVLPSLREKHDEFMLRELVKRWENYKIMVRWLTRFFHYLDRYFIPRRSLPSLNEVGLTCFRNVVYRELNAKVRDAVISLIDREREGEQIDRALLKNVLDIFVESGMDHYENDFEAAILRDTAAYYSRKASDWILKYSCPDYMLKAEECIRQEKHRFSHYFHSGSEPKLLEKVLHELFSVYAMQLLDKEHSGCHALFRDDDKVVEHELVSVNASELQEKETT